MSGYRASLYRLRWLIAGCGTLIAGLFFFFLTELDTDGESFLNNVLVFTLVNLNVIGLLVLVFLVGRNVVKLIFERRQGILGAKLRARLVGAFVLIACVPMTLSFLLSTRLINEAMEGWFNTQIDNAVTSSVTIARQHLTSVKNSVRFASERVSKALTGHLDLSSNSAAFSRELEELRRINDLYSVKVAQPNGTILGEAAHVAAGVDPFKEPRIDNDAIKRAARGDQVLRVEERGASQFVRLYAPLQGNILITSYRMDSEVVQAEGAVNESFNEYEQLKLFKHPLKINFLLTLALFNLLTLFGSTWIAFFIAKQITGPIQRLAEGTRNVAKGNYDFALDPIRDDEIGFLVESFNAMLSDLRVSRDEAERRGRLIEAILANLAVGVIALDNEQRVTTVNRAAAEILQLNGRENTTALPLHDLLRPEDYEPVKPIVAALEAAHGDEVPSLAEVELRIAAGGRELLVVCTGGRISTPTGGGLGFVLLFDDITELSRTQHLAAWRDVARRIAHEIKNPLTPIQLSAQRLEKLLGGPEAPQAVQESARTIVEHVAIIKRLANEFSEYGRMPTALFSPTDLSILVEKTVDTFVADHPEVRFNLEVDGKLPEMLLDAEQIRGVLINLLNNAVAAIQNEPQPSVHVRASFDRRTRRAAIEIIDNGPGIPAQDKHRIFEPYYTTKKGGTGLGLAIVSTIISDHQGEIRVFDHGNRGTRFIVRLPQHPQPSTARKLVAS